MKHFDAFEIDFDKCKSELAALKDLLKKFEATTLKEREHVLDFFRKNRHIAALAGQFMPGIVNVDRLAYEFDFFGDYAADLAVGDSKRRAYCFIEFENAAPDSIFVSAGKKSSLEWAKRFDKGYSQIIDWFWKLHEMAHTGTAQARFENATSFDYYGVLVIGRSQGLQPLERARLDWRRQRVIVDSRHVHCLTFDEFYEDLAFKLEKYGPAAIADQNQATT
jgi:Shedu protein SduA, C-terminal